MIASSKTKDLICLHFLEMTGRLQPANLTWRALTLRLTGGQKGKDELLTDVRKRRGRWIYIKTHITYCGTLWWEDYTVIIVLKSVLAFSSFKCSLLSVGVFTNSAQTLCLSTKCWFHPIFPSKTVMNGAICTLLSWQNKWYCSTEDKRQNTTIGEAGSLNSR